MVVAISSPSFTDDNILSMGITLTVLKNILSSSFKVIMKFYKEAVQLQK